VSSIAALVALAGGGGVAVGAALGSAWTRVRLGGTSVSTAATKPICGCSHSRGMHLEGKGECQGRRKLSANGIAEWLKCGCSMYDGPVPITEYYSPPMLPPGEGD
jgi:hypothetical protein